MKIVVLGAAGFVGRSAARELSARAEVRELLLVDYNIREAKRFAKSLSPKCRWAMADAGRPAELARLLEGVDAVANAVGPCGEYEARILRTCASLRVPAASIGDGTLAEEDRRGIHDAFRRAGAAAVSGCGMMPGWTELLSAWFAPGAGGPDAAPSRHLFCSLDRFGGYAFFRRLAREAGRPAPPPPGAPAGDYFALGEDLFGLPPGRPADLFRLFRRTLGRLGPVGRELAAAFLFWLRGAPGTGGGTPVAAAGVSGRGDAAAVVLDPGGRLAGALLGETALSLGAGRGGRETGLLALPEVIGREEAQRIAASCGATISAL